MYQSMRMYSYICMYVLKYMCCFCCYFGFAFDILKSIQISWIKATHLPSMELPDPVRYSIVQYSIALSSFIYIYRNTYMRIHTRTLRHTYGLTRFYRISRYRSKQLLHFVAISLVYKRTLVFLSALKIWVKKEQKTKCKTLNLMR